MADHTLGKLLHAFLPLPCLKYGFKQLLDLHLNTADTSI